jgi:hypothetical protein
MRSVWRGIVGIAALFLATAVSGQQLAILNVSVTDQSGGAIPRAQITIRSTEIGAKGNDTTNGDGLASISGFLAGNYKLLVSAAEFGQYQARWWQEPCR